MMTFPKFPRLPCLIGVVAVLEMTALGQLPPGEPPERMQSLSGNFFGQTDRPLRYFPQGHDFVITNGSEFFNRPLYSANTAFRVDGGDKPEFSLYLPGRGGNLRLGIKTASGLKWLHEAQEVVSRYHNGMLSYEIRDSGWNNRRLYLSVAPLKAVSGLIISAEADSGAEQVELVWAFGGANGMRGRRGGDIGCEREPVSEFFQLRPEQCREDKVLVEGNHFTLTGARGVIHGVMPGHAVQGIGNAEHWSNVEALLSSVAQPSKLPLVVGRIALESQPVFLGLQVQQPDVAMLKLEELSAAWQAARGACEAIGNRVVVNTPDAFINAAASALNVAADAVWDERQTSFMHGAVAWRNRLLGWRGVYSGDALGWHDRTRLHLEGFARQQNTNPIPSELPAPEAAANLSRNETALHSNGNMTKNHYDMNLVAIDAFFRHLLRTGDKEFARAYWPTLQRHLAWEQRMFRREFGEPKLPLYEGYASFWASDDVAYHGGGATYASAYNYYHNKMAARVAAWLGEEGAAYEREAELIAQGVRRELWVTNENWFAEFKDLLGPQNVHPSPGLWTFYHTIDAGLPTPREAWQMTRLVETELAPIPVAGPNVPPGSFTIPTSVWMPYAWSINNVVMAEATHAALACWQANRRELAFPLFKGALLDSMFLGLCPGNVGMCTEFDAYRHESQRDFADGVGATARALVEGLFGIKPDAIAGELVLAPGFPPDWNAASIQHPDLDFSFHREGLRDVIKLRSRFPRPLETRLQWSALRTGVQSVKVNGSAARWRKMDGVVGWPKIEIEAGAAAVTEVVVEWNGAEPVANAVGFTSGVRQLESQTIPQFAWGDPIPGAKFESLDLSALFNDRVTQIFRNEYLSPRSPYVSLALPKQGIGSWCLPNATFEVDDAGLRNVASNQEGRILMPCGVPFQTPATPSANNIAFVSQWDNYPRDLTVPLKGKSAHLYLLMAGSSNPMQSRIDNGEVVVRFVDGSSSRLPLHNPTTWWPIEQDYFVDDYAFRYEGELPARVDLATGKVRVLKMDTFKGRGAKVPGGAATALHLPLNPTKELESLTVRAMANEVVIGLMSVTLMR